MAKPLSILYVTSQVYPYTRVSEIAEISYSLTLALKDSGHDIRIMLPKYGIVSERRNRIHEINRLRDMAIPMGKDSELTTVKSSSIANPRIRVQAYITTNKLYFDMKKGVYKDPKTCEDYEDNDERYLFFNRSVVETCITLGWVPDIIHCNDWHTTLIPAYIKSLFPNKFKKTKILTTIHNFAEQGAFSMKTFQNTSLPKEIKGNLTHKNKFNFLKSGLVYADYINTLSPTYAKEILQDKKYSNELNSVLLERPNLFSGILCGVDSWLWNPKTDSSIAHKYSHDFFDFKQKNKKALLKEFGLEFKEDTPLIGFTSANDQYSGAELFIDSIEDIIKLKAQVVIIGEINNDLKPNIKKLLKSNPNAFSYKPLSEDLVNNLFIAGTDMTVFPALYEPNGLKTMYSMLYGSIPIAYQTGAINDIITPFTNNSKKSNGFLFNSYSSEKLIDSVKSAIELFNKHENWASICNNAMTKDFSWEKPTKYYDEIYRNIIKE